ncbi:Sorting nexin, cytoplasm-to-vacuole targeting pathway/endosomal sorting [Ceratocystis pirilliformis]|uniref:Sorting nexin, cytoplasm-to-vacuole targeting pathway/endosomal sorting n=1 Tax=Ceratocystis pirilliformis TaxID=259994 RepID=A0ABR3YMD4_9PEZI
MWNDEDNNPYGSGFDRRESFSSSSIAPSSPVLREVARSNRLHTPSSDEEDDRPREWSANRDNSPDSDDDVQPLRKPGGYDSRIEQMIYENPEIPILITDAGKSPETGGKFIVYTIRTGDLEVRRRYSEFASLRDALIRLHPTLIIPPIPEKHTMADYAARPTSAKQDQQIIDLRKRMLAVFLNRCRRMERVRADGVWWRFLDPNASWTEVLNSPPISTIPKSILKAPPLDMANPTPAHNWLPVPSASAKLKGLVHDPSVSPGIPARFPPDNVKLTEYELDPYFLAFETSIKDLEQLLAGPLEKVNKRTLSHLNNLAADYCELGGKFNAFALSEHEQVLGAAIEKIGQASDSVYLATEDLATGLGASFSEPMRENAQFAGVVRSVLRYRVLKRVQQDMTTDELAKKKALLAQLERSEAEAKRIEQYLSSSQAHFGSSPVSGASSKFTTAKSPTAHGRDTDDADSFDSDFPPTHSDFPVPSARQGAPEPAPLHRKMPSTNSITNKIFGPLRQAIQGVADVDPERSRRDMMGKTKESIEHLEQAQVVAEQDVKDSSSSILKDMKRFQVDKEDDLRRYMIAYAKIQIECAKKNRETWKETREDVFKIGDV